MRLRKQQVARLPSLMGCPMAPTFALSEMESFGEF
jgi:hypothetical protein